MPTQTLFEKATYTSKQLKLISNPIRLMVLCRLVEKECNVSELMVDVDVSQTLMSNHLAILRNANIVDYRREHRTLNYFIKDEKVKVLLSTLHSLYCK